MKEERREQILKEALCQFASKGLFATKIKDIAEGVGMAQGLVYHYYKSKEEIYVSLIHNALDKMSEAVEALEAMALPAHEKIHMAIVEMMKTVEESEVFNQTCRLIAQATNSTAIPKEAQQFIEEKRDIPYQAISRIIAEGQKMGTIIEGDPYQLAILFWTSINGLAIFKASREDQPSLPEANLLIRVFIKNSAV